MKKGMFLILTAMALVLAGCAGTGAETTAATEASAEATVETTVETSEETVPETTEVLRWDYDAQERPIRLFLNDRDRTGVLADGDRETGRLIAYGDVLRIEGEEPFSALYLQWDAAPSPYRLLWEGGEVEAGSEGFQHDYVRLPEAVTAVTFAFSDYLEPVLVEAAAFTEGNAPAGTQDWQLPEGPADLLVFPTHSDDDALFFGALMSYYAMEMKLEVQTAFMTRHHDQPIRAHERLDGLWEVGVRRYPVLGEAPDLYSKTLAEARYEYAAYDILGWQIGQIRRFQPQVIVAHDLNGEYGHGGHMLSAHTMTRSVELAADPAAYPDTAAEFGTWDTPKLYFHLYGENQIAIDVDTPLERDPLGRTPFEIAVAAYDHHKSQHWCAFRVSRTDPEQNCVYFGLYRSLVGEDTTGNLMDNIGYG